MRGGILIIDNTCALPPVVYAKVMIRVRKKHGAVSGPVKSDPERSTLMEQEKTQYEIREYVTFHVTARDGRDVEMAVVDEFDIENRHYVVGSVVEDDEIKADGQYIYRCHIKDDDFTVEPILDPKEFDRVSRAYMKLN